MDDIEEWVNDRLRELFIPYLAKFPTKLKQAQADIIELKRQPVSSMFDPSYVEIDEKKDLVDLMGISLK